MAELEDLDRKVQDEAARSGAEQSARDTKPTRVPHLIRDALLATMPTLAVRSDTYYSQMLASARSSEYLLEVSFYNNRWAIRVHLIGHPWPSDPLYWAKDSVEHFGEYWIAGVTHGDIQAALPPPLRIRRGLFGGNHRYDPDESLKSARALASQLLAYATSLIDE